MPISFGPLLDHGLRLGYSSRKAAINIAHPGDYPETDICGNEKGQTFQFAASGQGKEDCNDLMTDRFSVSISAFISAHATTPNLSVLASGLTYADLDGATYNVATFTAKGFTLKGTQLIKGDIGGGTPEFTATFGYKDARDVCGNVIGTIRSLAVQSFEQDEDCNVFTSGTASISWLKLDANPPAIAATFNTLGLATMITNFIGGSDVVPPYTALIGTTISI